MVTIENQLQWYSCVVNSDIAGQYEVYFRENDIYFEPSGCGDHVHFEVLMTDAELESFNKWIKEKLKL